MEKLQLARVKTNITFNALGFSAFIFFYSMVDEGKSLVRNYITGREVVFFLIAGGFRAWSFEFSKYNNSIRVFYINPVFYGIEVSAIFLFPKRSKLIFPKKK